MNDRTKHLEMIQTVVARHASAGFSIRGWAVVLVSALVGLAAKDANPRYAVVVVLPVLMFWALDAYYLRQERLFRALYDHVRCTSETDFSMDTTSTGSKVDSWWLTLFARPLLFFYLPLCGVSVGVTLAAVRFAR